MAETSRSAILYLTGLSGAGKSKTGRLLAKALDSRFVDLDLEVERLAGRTVSQIFSSGGEKRFRKLESTALRGLVESSKLPGAGQRVVSLGGGALLRKSNSRLVMRSGTLIWLDVSCAEAARRLYGESNRPLTLDAHGAPLSMSALTSRLQELLRQRRPGFLSADIRVRTTDRTAAVARNEILRRLKTLS